MRFFMKFQASNNWGRFVCDVADWGGSQRVKSHVV